MILILFALANFFSKPALPVARELGASGKSIALFNGKTVKGTIT